MVKVINATGRTEKFNSNDIENDLTNIGLPESVAEEVAERVEDRVENGWTTRQVKEQVGIELTRLDEDMDRARTTYVNRMQHPAM